MQKIADPNKAKKIVVRCSPELRQAVRMEAARRDVSVERLCADLIARGLGIAEKTEAA